MSTSLVSYSAYQVDHQLNVVYKRHGLNDGLPPQQSGNNVTGHFVSVQCGEAYPCQVSYGADPGGFRHGALPALRDRRCFPVPLSAPAGGPSMGMINGSF